MQEDIKRLPHLDISKAIGIILIVVGHSFPEQSDSSIRSFVYLFHVPLFFIISGYFFPVRQLDNPKKIIINKFKRLWIPFFLWSSIFISTHNLLFSLHIYSEDMVSNGYSVSQYLPIDFIKNFFKLFLFKESEQLLGAFWFIPCLFFTTIFFLFCLILSKKIQIRNSLLLIAFSSFIIGNFMFIYDLKIPYIPYDIRLIFITNFLYFLGYCYKKYNNVIPITFKLAAFSLIILIFINTLDLIKINSIHSTIGYLQNSILFLVVTPILGTYLTIYVSVFLTKFKHSYVLLFIGKNTITILALHFLCFKLVNYYIITKQNLSMSYMAHFPVIPNNESYFIIYVISGILIPITLQFLIIYIKSQVDIFIKNLQER